MKENFEMNENFEMKENFESTQVLIKAVPQPHIKLAILNLENTHVELAQHFEAINQITVLLLKYFFFLPNPVVIT